MGKEHIAVKILISVITSNSNQLDLFECVDESLGYDNYLKIGIKAIRDEIKILNNVHIKGVKVIRKAEYKTLNENLYAGWKVAAWAILTLLTRGVGLIALLAIAGISAGVAERKMEKLRNKVNATKTFALRGRLGGQEPQEILDYNSIVFSLGAGGIKGMFIPGKFTCYMIRYPKYEFETLEAKIAFLDYMCACRAVPNSMFCWIGSGRQYMDASNRLRGRLSSTDH